MGLKLIYPEWMKGFLLCHGLMGIKWKLLSS